MAGASAAQTEQQAANGSTGEQSVEEAFSQHIATESETPFTDAFLGRRSGGGEPDGDGLNEIGKAVGEAIAEEEGAEGGDGGETGGQDAEAGQGDVDGEIIEYRFGQSTFPVPAALKPLADQMDKAVRSIQGSSDKRISALETKIAEMSAAQVSGGRDPGRPGSPSPAAAPPPPDEVLREAEELDEALGAGGRFKALIQKQQQKAAALAIGAARAAREDVERTYGPSLQLVQLESVLSEKVAEQMELDAENPRLGRVVSELKAEEVAPLVMDEIRASVKAGRPYDAMQIYREVLMDLATRDRSPENGGGADRKQVSKTQQINGHAKANGAAGNGQSPVASRAAASASGGLGRTARMPAAMRGSANGARTAETVNKELDAVFARHRPEY